MGTLSVPSTIQARRQIALTSRSLMDENMPLGHCTTSGAPSSQVIIGGLVGLRAGDVVTNIVVNVVTPGTSTAPTTIKLALVDTAGVVRGVTANEAANANWTAAGGGNYAFALTAAYTIPADAGYYACILEDGAFAGTALAIARSNAASVAGMSKQLGTGARVGCRGGTGQTNITGTLTLADAGSSEFFWFGVS